MKRMFALPMMLVLAGCQTMASDTHSSRFPVEPLLFNDQFEASEGLTFSGDGKLYVGANRGIWRLDTNGNATRLADVTTHLGQAGIGEDHILAADFGPLTEINHGPDAPKDGIVWRITPDGEKEVAVEGIGDPNAILILPDRTMLVSDDFTNHIYHVGADGKPSVWSDAVPYPNGIALSPDGKTVYAAQIFETLRPVKLIGKLWAIDVNDDLSAGDARVVADLDGRGADGIAIDVDGRVYIADNGNGRLLRYDPDDGSVITIAENMPHIASVVFGEGDFDRFSIYATTTFRGGGKIWRIPVGVQGAKLHR